MVCCWDADGCAYSGFQDGKIFQWRDRQVEKCVQGHGGCIEAIRWVDNVLYTGARDGKVMCWSTPDLA